MSDLTGKVTGERIKHFRNRVGMTRPVLGGLVGRSAEWVKAVETGRLQVPRLLMLLKIARVLDVRDLAELAGDGHAVPVQVFAGQAHAALTAVQAALTDYRLPARDAPVNVAHPQLRLDQAWEVRHSSPDHRTAEDVAYQPAPELVWLVADRAIAEAQEADDPYAIADGAWALNHALRDAGRWEEVITVALDGVGYLEPWLTCTHDDDWRGMWGALQYEAGYTHARRGSTRRSVVVLGAGQRDGPAARYRHIQTSFSTAVMNAHAVILDVELRRPGDAVRTANGFDANEIPSLARRSRQLIEVACVHHQRHDGTSTYAMLHAAERTAPQAIRFNSYARDILISLAAAPPAGLRDEVPALCGRIGVLL